MNGSDNEPPLPNPLLLSGGEGEDCASRNGSRNHISSTMNRIFCSLLFLAMSMLLHAQEPTAILLWPDGAHGALGKEDKDIPTITPFLPEQSSASGAAMVILPGGGYGALAPHEGKGYADWL